MFRYLLLFLTVSIRLVFYEPVVFDGQMYDDATASQLITVITITNPIPSIPSTEFIYQAQKSLFYVPAFALCKRIIVFDGIQPGWEDRAEDYEQYKRNVIELTKSDPYFMNTDLLFCPSWVHLSGAIKEALEHVSTPFIFIHPHDMCLLRNFDLNGLIASMAANSNIKYVHLAVGPNNAQYGDFWGGPIDQIINGPHFIPLCRFFGWSDLDHVARRDYYVEFVLPQCIGHDVRNYAMETLLHPMLKDCVYVYFGKDEGHRPFGTYLLGDPSDGGYTTHLDARNIYE